MGFFHEVYKEGMKPVLDAEEGGKAQTAKQSTPKSGGTAAEAPKLLAFLSDELDHAEMRVQYEVNFGTYVEMRAADLWRATATTSRRLQGGAGGGGPTSLGSSAGGNTRSDGTDRFIDRALAVGAVAALTLVLAVRMEQRRGR